MTKKQPAKEMVSRTDPPKKVKFFWNGLKVDGVFHRGQWREPDSEGKIVLRGKNYKDLPNIGLPITDNSESMTDYFENKYMVFEPGTEFYEEAKRVCKICADRDRARHEEYMAKFGQRRIERYQKTTEKYERLIPKSEQSQK